MNVYVVSLGCPKNRTDTEETLGLFRELDPKLKIVEDREEADLILINTCGFIQEAVEESIETILELALGRSKDQKIAVMGCLYKRYGDELKKELPEVDIFWGHEIGREELSAIYSTLAPLLKVDDLEVPPIQRTRILTTPPWRAYVKLLEGCSNRCTYCLIPKIRGPKRPRPLPEIMEELRALSAQGIKEVTLVGQDLTGWEWEGMRLLDLLERVEREVEIKWVRLLYFHPSGVDMELLNGMVKGHKVLNYADIPIQHASSRVLKRMGRPYSLDYLKRLFGTIREEFPGLTLRTTVMVGFPGETDQDFRTLEDFIREVEFDHLGCFVYSDEEGAPSRRLHGKVPPRVAKERQEAILEIQREISKRRLGAHVGKTLEVLVEGPSRETDLLLEGRASFQAEGIDGVVYINEGVGVPGEFFEVEILDSFDYDLLGRIIRPLAGPVSQSVQSSCRRSPQPPC